MIKTCRAAAFAAIALTTACFGLTSVAEAGTIVIARDTSNYSGSNGGGEDAVTTFTDGPSLASMGSGVGVSGSIFQTFCVETTEPISAGQTYDWSLSTSAVAGGYSGGNPDPLDSRTAFLYHKFLSGTLSGYNYTQGSGRLASSTSLQLAIWQLEGEIQPGALTDAYNNDSQAQAWVAAANAAIQSGGEWENQGLGNVRILNLTKTDSTGAVQNAQSMLVEISPVPLPPAALLGLGLMAGMSGVGIVRRRHRGALS